MVTDLDAKNNACKEVPSTTTTTIATIATSMTAIAESSAAPIVNDVNEEGQSQVNIELDDEEVEEEVYDEASSQSPITITKLAAEEDEEEEGDNNSNNTNNSTEQLLSMHETNEETDGFSVTIDEYGTTDIDKELLGNGNDYSTNTKTIPKKRTTNNNQKTSSSSTRSRQSAGQLIQQPISVNKTEANESNNSGTTLTILNANSNDLKLESDRRIVVCDTTTNKIGITIENNEYGKFNAGKTNRIYKNHEICLLSPGTKTNNSVESSNSVNGCTNDGISVSDNKSNDLNNSKLLNEHNNDSKLSSSFDRDRRFIHILYKFFLS